MSKVKKILCIHPEPSELRISALLNRQGLPVDLTEAALPEALTAALGQPQWWDLILCDAAAFFDQDLSARLEVVGDRTDASLVLLKSSEDDHTPADGFRSGAADVVSRDDMDHLLMVCEREIRNAETRKQLRKIRYSVAHTESANSSRLMVATINDLGKPASGRFGPFTSTPAPVADESVVPLDLKRIRSLIDAGGLVLEYQPIISFKANEEHRNMFEALVRLQDESGRLLLPDVFLPAAAKAGWIGKIDLWIFRQVIAVLEQMQAEGARDATLFVNLATETFMSEQTVRAIGTFIAAARLAPGSIVIEVRKSAFTHAHDGLHQLVAMLKLERHGVLIEDLRLDDCKFIEANRDLITHLKLSREITRGLVEGSASQHALNAFVKCAHQEGVRVIALAVESADLMPMLFAAGVNAIQGNFMSMPNRELMYPSVRLIETG